jgi:hypothetical protein
MIWDFGDGLTDFRLNPPHLFAERKLYSVRLIAVNDCGRDTIFKSIDLRPNGVQDVAQAFDLKCFPNPFDDALSVQFYVSERSTIRFELYDVAGKLVDILSQKADYTEGAYQHNFSVREMPKGVYFLKLVTEKGMVFRRVVKM